MQKFILGYKRDSLYVSIISGQENISYQGNQNVQCKVEHLHCLKIGPRENGRFLFQVGYFNLLVTLVECKLKTKKCKKKQNKNGRAPGVTHVNKMTCLFQCLFQ